MSSAGDLLTMCQLKKTDEPDHFHNDQYQAQSVSNILFGKLNGRNSSKLAPANLRK